MSSENKKFSLRYLEKKEFLKYFLPEIGIGGLQWVTSKNPDNGDIIPLSIRFAGYPQVFELQARVVWRKSKPPMRPDLPEGVGLEFVSKSAAVLRELQHFADSEESAALQSIDDRSEARIRVNLEVEYLYNEEMVRERVLDISAGGLFISTEKILPEDQRFIFFLHDDNFVRPWVMEGRVVWANREGKKKGFAVKCLFDSRKHKREVRQYVAALAEEIKEL